MRVAMCSAYPTCLLAGPRALQHAEGEGGGGRWCCADDREEMLLDGSHRPDPLADGVRHPRALHPLQPSGPCTQMCSRITKCIGKTPSGAKGHSARGADLTVSDPAVGHLLGQRVGSFKRCCAPWLRAIVKHRRGGRGACREHQPLRSSEEGWV